MTDLRTQLQASLGSAYTIGRELGGGGMSRVFVAQDAALGRPVVVKVLAPELTAGVNVDRFKREIRVAASLQHPHIVPVLHAGETDGLPYFTMPFVEGQSLRTRLTQVGALPIGEVVSILRDVAKALEFAHARDVVHRDIKPDNVLLAGNAAVVTDFGIAKALSASRTSPGATLTQAGTSLGTPAYMAPEQAAADPTTNHRADIYAFGVLGYELLVALTAAPNNYDSLTYHLSRAADWKQHASIEWIANAPTARMNEFQPLAEQEILFGFVAAGSGVLYALPQFIAQLAILTAVYGASRRLGFERLAAVRGAALLATFGSFALHVNF